MNRTIISYLVGSYFCRASDLILDILPTSTPLILTPEPENPYDEQAIKVLLASENLRLPPNADEELAEYGSSIHDLMEMGEIHLGYIAKSGGKPADGLPGNVEVLELMATSPNYTAELAFTPEGKALVKVQSGD